jgi:UDP-N-acetylmuramate dehydrogenase
MTPAQHQAAQHQAAQHQAAQHQAAQDQLAHDQLTQDQLTQDQLTQDQLTQDQLTQDQLTQDQLAQDQLAQDQLAQDQLAQDQPARHQVALSAYTTLGLGGPARRFVTAVTEGQIVAEVQAADQRGEPLLVLGGGSNLVVADDGFDGTVLRIASRGVSLAEKPPAENLPAENPSAQNPPAQNPPAETGAADDVRAVTVTAAAGEDWDAFARRCAGGGLAGTECLAGIPGLVGATPIQNVGAYGQEVAETITTVRGYDRARREVVELTAAQCAFGYRTSLFKREPGRFVVLSVTFRLTRDAMSMPVRYAELARTLGVAVGDRVPLADTSAAVLGLRRGKGMVLDPDDPDTRSAGSFFTNPVISQAALAAVEDVARARFGPDTAVPRFPAGDGRAGDGRAGDGRVKVPAAWLIERAGFARGYPGGAGVRISAKHTLALVNQGSGTTKDLLGLAAEIRDGVLASFGIELSPEPVLVGVTL